MKDFIWRLKQYIAILYHSLTLRWDERYMLKLTDFLLTWLANSPRFHFLFVESWKWSSCQSCYTTASNHYCLKAFCPSNHCWRNCCFWSDNTSSPNVPCYKCCDFKTRLRDGPIISELNCSTIVCSSTANCYLSFTAQVNRTTCVYCCCLHGKTQACSVNSKARRK